MRVLGIVEIGHPCRCCSISARCARRASASTRVIPPAASARRRRGRGVPRHVPGAPGVRYLQGRAAVPPGGAASRRRSTLACGRCLEDFRLPVDASFDLLYLPHAENAGEGEVEVEDDDLTTAYYRDDQIDLGQLVREQFYLAIPMKPLCRDVLPGALPRVRDEPEHRVRAPARPSGPTRGSRASSRCWTRATGRFDAGPGRKVSFLFPNGRVRPTDRRDSMPNPKRRHSKARGREAAHPRRPHAGCARASARSATSRSCRTRCARTAATTAGGRCVRSRKGSRPAPCGSGGRRARLYPRLPSTRGRRPRARARSWTGRWPRRASCRCRLTLVGPGGRRARALAAMPGARVARRAPSCRLGRGDRDGRAAGGRAAAAAGRVHPGRGRPKWRRGRADGALQRREHRRDGDGRVHAAFGHAAAASSARRWPRRSRRGDGAAVLLDVGANVRVPAAAPGAVRRDGRRCSPAWRSASSARASALLSIGEEETKGNDLTREAHRAAEGDAASTSPATSRRATSTRAAPTSSSATGSPATSRSR